MGRVRVGAIAIAIVGMFGCSDREGPPGEDGGVDAGTFDGGSIDGGTFDGAIDGGRDADTFDASGDDADTPDDDAGTDAGEREDAQVVGESCGSDSECRAGFCDFPDDACGGGERGVCDTPADLCPLDCPGVCGCDGRFYCNTCLAHANSIDVAADDRSCRAGSCRPMDARGMGDCDLAFGFAWNGVRCATVSGCACIGDECGALYDRSEACELAYDGCSDEPAPGATCGTIAGSSATAKSSATTIRAARSRTRPVPVRRAPSCAAGSTIRSAAATDARTATRATPRRRASTSRRWANAEAGFRRSEASNAATDRAMARAP